MRKLGKVATIMVMLATAALAQRATPPPASIFSSGGATPPPASIYSLPSRNMNPGFGAPTIFIRPGHPHQQHQLHQRRFQSAYPVYVPYAAYGYDYPEVISPSDSEIENGGTFQSSRRGNAPFDANYPAAPGQQGSFYQPAPYAPAPPASEQDSRYGTHYLDGREQLQHPRTEASAPQQSANRVVTPNSLDDGSPTLLIFRDGHQQEVTNYAIMGTTIFVLSGERAKIPVSEIDVPKTVAANEKRGIDFHVPKS